MSIPQFSILTDPLVRQKTLLVNQIDGNDSQALYDGVLDMHRTAHAVSRTEALKQTTEGKVSLSNLNVEIRTKEAPTANIKGKAAKKAAKRYLRAQAR